MNINLKCELFLFSGFWNSTINSSPIQRAAAVRFEAAHHAKSKALLKRGSFRKRSLLGSDEEAMNSSFSITVHSSNGTTLFPNLRVQRCFWPLVRSDADTENGPYCFIVIYLLVCLGPCSCSYHQNVFGPGF